jgi:hypothetical protein
MFLSGDGSIRARGKHEWSIQTGSTQTGPYLRGNSPNNPISSTIDK